MQTLVLPNTTAPASRRRATVAASRAARWPIRSGTPAVVGKPSTSIDSFTVTGKPSSAHRPPQPGDHRRFTRHGGRARSPSRRLSSATRHIYPPAAGARREVPPPKSGGRQSRSHHVGCRGVCRQRVLSGRQFHERTSNWGEICSTGIPAHRRGRKRRTCRS